MKTTLTIAAALAFVVSVYAQKDKDRPSFGDITPEEIKMERYELDTTAKAVILFDIGSVTLRDDLSATFKRHVRVKFFTTNDMDEYASKTLYYEPANENITKLKASTYNMENGTLVESKLDDEGIFKSKVDKVTHTIKFTLPNVKPGSIIEYSYTRSMTASLLPSWQFQHTIPTLYSEYETSIPNSFDFKKEVQGFLTLSLVESKGPNERLVMRDAPAFKVEPFITTPDDYVSAVNYYIRSIFSGKTYNLERTWGGIARDYDESADFGGVVKGNSWLAKTVEPIIAGATTPEEKAKKIHDYIKTNIVWNEIVDKIPDHMLKKVLDDKKGTASEINMLMIAMMKRAGLDANPVLLSTRDHGIIHRFTPYGEQFNYVICLVKIDGKNRLIDGTDKTLPFTSLPERCLNGEGLVIMQDSAKWIPIVANRARMMYSADFKLSADGEMTGNLSITHDGLFGGDMRSSYNSLGREKYVAASFSNKSWEFGKSEFKNMDVFNESPNEAHQIVIRDHAQVNGDVIYVNPYVAGLEENKFKSETREYPVNMPTAFDRIYMAKITVPEGYKVDELPPNRIFLLPDGGGKFVYNTSVVGSTINFTSHLSVTKNLVTADKYPLLREFYATVVAKQAEQIVLKKTP